MKWEYYAKDAPFHAHGPEHDRTLRELYQQNGSPNHPRRSRRKRLWCFEGQIRLFRNPLFSVYRALRQLKWRWGAGR